MRVPEMKAFFQQHFNETYSNSFILRVVKRWRWSLRCPDPRQIHKYTQKNCQYYIEYCLEILLRFEDKDAPYEECIEE